MNTNSLLKPETHRRLLDEYAGSQELARAEVQLAAQRWKQPRMNCNGFPASATK